MLSLDYHIEGGNFSKAGFASTEVKRLLKQLNIDSEIIRRTVIAIYEGEVNVVAHAYEGAMHVIISDENIHIEIDDKGPGIADIEEAMRPGFSTASDKVREMGFGAGMGLPNIKDHSDFFNLESSLGVGTKVTIINQFKV